MQLLRGPDRLILLPPVAGEDAERSLGIEATERGVRYDGLSSDEDYANATVFCPTRLHEGHVRRLGSIIFVERGGAVAVEAVGVDSRTCDGNHMACVEQRCLVSAVCLDLDSST